MGKIVKGQKNDSAILEPALLLVNRWPYMTCLLAGSFAGRSGRSAGRLSVVNRRVVGAPCQDLPKRSPAKRDFRDYWDYVDNGERKIKKSKEGASSSTSKVDEDLVRSFCLFSVMAPLFTFSRIRGKLIWFLVQHNLTSSDFLEWKKRLIHEEANIFIILLSWSSLKREHVLFPMIERVQIEEIPIFGFTKREKKIPPSTNFP